jgi:hypothetical protein
MTEDRKEQIECSQEDSSEQNPASNQSKRAEGVVTIVLTADNHLGYTTFGQQPRKREERQQRLRQAFQQATDFAIGQGVDFFIQAGDLFDTPTPDERDRSFVAARLAQLRQAGVHTFALGGTHDTPPTSHRGDVAPAPQRELARLGVLHYLPPRSPGDAPPSQMSVELEPVMIDIRGTLVGICGLGVVAGEEGDPLAQAGSAALERAAIRLLVLHAPIEGIASMGTPEYAAPHGRVPPIGTIGDSALIGGKETTRQRVARRSIANQNVFRFILAGYHHSYQRTRIGSSDLVVAGSTALSDVYDPEGDPGFVFIGLAADGMRWCNHIRVEALTLQRLVIHVSDVFPSENVPSPIGTIGGKGMTTPTDTILERLRPLCSMDAMLQLRLEGELTRGQYHQLNLNQIRRYGEEHCFALAIDDSTLSLLPEQDAISAETGERFSPREELIALADEWIAEALDEQEEKALRATKEALLAAMEEVKR